MKRRLIIFSSLLILISSCKEKNSSEHNLTQHSNLKPDFNERMKSAIYKEAVNYHKDAHIFDITVCQLNQGTVLYIHPILDNEYLKNEKKPYLSFEFDSLLFLVYSGLEKLINTDANYVTQVLQKFDSVCLKYKIGVIKSTFDLEPKFFKVEADSLVPFENFEFQNLFFAKKIDTSKYVPVEIK